MLLGALGFFLHLLRLKLSTDASAKMERDVLVNGFKWLKGEAHEGLLFKRDYFERLDDETKAVVRDILRQLIRRARNWPRELDTSIAGVCVDLELYDVADEVKAAFSRVKARGKGREKGWLEAAVKIVDLDVPESLKFFFTEPFTPDKTEQDHARFRTEYFRLPPDTQQAVLSRIRELTLNESTSLNTRLAIRAVVALSEIDKEEAREAARRIFPNGVATKPQKIIKMPDAIVKLLSP